MPSETPESGCCLPGDITITKVERGYMLGRAIREYGQGPWWEYVKVVETYGAAVAEARALAQAGNARVWRHQQGAYQPIPDDEAPLEEVR